MTDDIIGANLRAPVSSSIVNPLKIAYRYCCGDDSVTLEEMQNRLCDALCEAIGDDEFQKFAESMGEEQ